MFTQGQLLNFFGLFWRCDIFPVLVEFEFRFGISSYVISERIAPATRWPQAYAKALRWKEIEFQVWICDDDFRSVVDFKARKYMAMSIFDCIHGYYNPNGLATNELARYLLHTRCSNNVRVFVLVFPYIFDPFISLIEFFYDKKSAIFILHRITFPPPPQTSPHSCVDDLVSINTQLQRTESALGPRREYHTMHRERRIRNGREWWCPFFSHVCDVCHVCHVCHQDTPIGTFPSGVIFFSFRRCWWIMSPTGDGWFYFITKVATLGYAGCFPDPECLNWKLLN